jgi:hypothetical protein
MLNRRSALVAMLTAAVLLCGGVGVGWILARRGPMASERPEVSPQPSANTPAEKTWNTSEVRRGEFGMRCADATKFLIADGLLPDHAPARNEDDRERLCLEAYDALERSIDREDVYQPGDDPDELKELCLSVSRIMCPTWVRDHYGS